MEIDNKILKDVMNRFGISREQAENALHQLIDEGLLQQNTDPSIPIEFKLTNQGNKYAEKNIIEQYGEFKKVTDHKGISYKVPVIVILREGIKEEELSQFPLWSESDG